MRKGISPIVAVVLLIAIAVIAAVGLYFWVGGLATRQPTPSTPLTISAYALDCVADSDYNTSIMIANTSPPGRNITAGSLETAWEHGIAANSSTEADTCPGENIESGAQVTCVLINYSQGDGTTAIFGANVGSATVTC